MEKLPEEFKQKWVAALRSGEYKQARTTIYNRCDDSFCCIGVAAMELGINVRMGKNVSRGYRALPKAITGGFDNPTAVSLIRMNDTGATFSQIADWIGRKPLTS